MDISALKVAAASFKSALQRNDRQALLAAARRLVELDAPLGNQWQGLAQAVFGWGELDLALQALDTWRRQGATANSVAYEKATLLSRAGRSAEAAKIVASLPEHEPSPVANAYLRGALAINLGRPGEAVANFRRAIRARPDSGRSWLGIAQAGDVSDADRLAMLRLAASASIEDEEDLAAVENALGLVEHRRGNRAEAFAHFDRSTQIVRKARPHDRTDNERSAQIAGSWTAADISVLGQRPPDGSRRPILVTGIPRSGTTLVQQILASHSAVDGGGELGLTMQLEAIIGGFAPEDVRKYLATGGSVAELRDTYLRLVGERIPGDGAFIDKSLNQSRALGPLSLLFPDAPILWLRRDPLDNAWSIFRTWMSRSAVGGWSLGDIAHHMKLEDALLEHWSRELGERVLVVPYGYLVDDPRAWTERITRHCGFEPEPEQFEFHLAERGVSTASAIQVREPVNRKGIGIAQPYREQLQPFLDAYFGDAVTGT